MRNKPQKGIVVEIVVTNLEQLSNLYYDHGLITAEQYVEYERELVDSFKTPEQRRKEENRKKLERQLDKAYKSLPEELRSLR